MSEVKMVPAVCTQCGGALEVDPSRETGVCPFCGSTYVIEKAINQYNVQHAKIEHADNVNIDMTGAVHSVLDFVGKQMEEGREARKEERREERRIREKNDQMMMKAFFGIFAIMVVLGFGAFILMNVFDIGGDDTAAEAEYEAGDAYYEIENGNLVVSIPDAGGYTWEVEDYETTAVLVDSELSGSGYVFTFAGEEDLDEGVRYAVLQELDDESDDPVGYLVYRFRVADYVVAEVQDSAFVENLSDYDFAQ